MEGLSGVVRRWEAAKALEQAAKAALDDVKLEVEPGERKRLLREARERWRAIGQEIGLDGDVVELEAQLRGLQATMERTLGGLEAAVAQVPRHLTARARRSMRRKAQRDVMAFSLGRFGDGAEGTGDCGRS